eukprot:1136819_1
MAALNSIDNDLKENLKLLVDDYFANISSPSNVGALCHLMTDDVEAIFTQADVYGIDKYRKHITTNLTLSGWICNRKIIANEYDFFVNAEDEIVGSVSWKCDVDLTGCCYCCCVFFCCLWPLCCVQCKHFETTGINTFKFEISNRNNPKISFVMAE